MKLGPKPIHRKISADIGQLDFQQHSHSAAQRVLLLASMTTVAVVLLAASTVIQMGRGNAPDQIASNEPVVEVAVPAVEAPTNETAVIDKAAIAADPEPVFADASVCEQDLVAIARFSTIYFEDNSVMLDMSDVRRVRQVVEALQKCPGMTLQVWGHTDGGGDDATNVRISQQRADNTLAAVKAMGFDTSFMQALAAGASLPLAQGDTDDDLDRRVEFRIVPLE